MYSRTSIHISAGLLLCKTNSDDLTENRSITVSGLKRGPNFRQYLAHKLKPNALESDTDLTIRDKTIRIKNQICFANIVLLYCKVYLTNPLSTPSKHHSHCWSFPVCKPYNLLTALLILFPSLIETPIK